MPTVINALPFTITVPGDYILASDLTTVGHGIIVQASNVTIDFNGHTISGPKAANNQFFGVVSFNYDDITIRNGSLNSFFYGIYLSDLVDSKSSAAQLDGGGHLIESMDISGATFRGIRIEGQDNIVRDNVIRNIGGTSVYVNPYAMGIETFGLNALIDNNMIRDVRGGGAADIGEGVGISISRYGNGTLLSNNHIINSSPDVDALYGTWPAQSRSTYGIWVGGDGSEDLHVNGNTVDNFVYGITFKRTVFGDFADNNVTNAIVPYYLPFNDGERVLDNGGNLSSLGPSELAFARSTPGPIETVELIYLSPLPRGDGFLFFPVHNDAGNFDNTITGSAGLDMADYWNAASAVNVNLTTNTVTGGGGNDTLSGIEGAQGSKFNDTITGGTGPNLLSGAQGNDNLFGQGGGDFLFGGAGNDTLNGGGSNDTLTGAAGNDIYYVDNASDRVIEAVGGGTDRVLVSMSWALEANSEVERIDTTNQAGTSPINLIGNAFNQTLIGNAGDNTLSGLAGADNMRGLGGNDQYFVDHASDRSIEAVGGGNDRVLTSVSYTLEAGSEIELFTTNNTASTSAINLTGNEFANTFLGNDGANIINGRGGADVMRGLGGNDKIYGQHGNDTIDGGPGSDIIGGGAGNDTMTGGAANDIFIFRAGYGQDRITDFQGGTGLFDQIDMRGLFNSFSECLAASQQVGADLVITVNSSTILTIEDFYRGNFAADDIII